MIKSNEQTQLVPMNDDTMSIASLDGDSKDAVDRSAPVINELEIKKPFNSWRECRKTIYRNYSDILNTINKHVDLRQLSLIQHVLIWVIPSLLKPIEDKQCKMQNKYYRAYRYDQIKTRIKDTKVSFIGIVKTIIKVILFIVYLNRNQRCQRTTRKWRQLH